MSLKHLTLLFLIFFNHQELTAKDLVSDKRLIHFQEVPLMVEESLNEINELKICIYDPADSIFAPKNIPFIKIEAEFDENGNLTGELSELGRTESFNGAQLLELVKHLQAEYQISRLEIIDVASTLTCPMDGFLCEKEALNKLSTILVFLSGKGFYERAGAIPLDEDGEKDVYLSATHFLHQTLRIDQFVNNLLSLDRISPKATELGHFIHEAVVLTHSSETDRISDLFLKTRAQANQDQTIHQTWHGLLNRLVDGQDHFLLELSDHVICHSDQYPEAVSHYCAFKIIDYVDSTISIIESEDENPENRELLRDYFFDNQLEFFELLIKDYLDTEEDEEEEDTEKSILFETFKNRLDQSILIKTWKRNNVYISNLREIYYRAKAFEKDEKMEADWDKLAQWIKESPAEEDVYLKWFIAKEILYEFNLFEFILVHCKVLDQKN